MAQRARELFPERSPKHALGAELRRLRVERGLSQDRLGELVHHSGALIGKIEKAERLPTAELCTRVDAALETDGHLTRMRPAAHPRSCGVPVDLVVSPWTAPESHRLLCELAGKTIRDREFVALTGANLVAVLTGWNTAEPAPAEPDGPCPESGVVRAMTQRLAGLTTLVDALGDTVRCDLAFAELRFLADLITNSERPAHDHRHLFALAAEVARLCGRLQSDTDHPGPAQTYYLLALRCAAAAADGRAARQILTAMSRRATLAGHPDDARMLREAPDRRASRNTTLDAVTET